MDLSYAIVNENGIDYLNHSKITKEDAFEIIKENSIKTVVDFSTSILEEKGSIPENFDSIKGLLNTNGVYATPSLDFNHFKDEKLIGTFKTCTMRSSDISGFIKDINKFIERGLSVYIYSYCILPIDRYIDDETTIQEFWFWYRIGYR